jgi:hypothetical protein
MGIAPTASCVLAALAHQSTPIRYSRAVHLRSLFGSFLVVSACCAGSAVARADDVREPSSVRLGIQGRLSAINVSLTDDTLGPGALLPFATPGVRFGDGRVFVGVGFGVFGVQDSNTGISVSPLVTVDLLRDPSFAALYVAGAVHIASFEEELVVGDRFGFGLSVALGVRGEIHEAIGLGVEWGWGFVSLSGTSPTLEDVSIFAHAMTGSIVLEASLGL